MVLTHNRRCKQTRGSNETTVLPVEAAELATRAVATIRTTADTVEKVAKKLEGSRDSTGE
jgi:hypothetical protein